MPKCLFNTKTKSKMKQLLVVLISAVMLISCQTDSEKADKLRLENKFDEAAELYQKAANEGDAYAMWRLSNAYSNGDGVEWDKAKALNLLKQAALGGCEEAKCDLSFAYMFGWYEIEQDAEKGKTMLDDLVKTTENSTVLSEYASLLFLGKAPYEEDKEKVMRILNKIEDKNNPFYLELMGVIYANGTDEIEIDVEKATEYFSKAFENGRRSCAYKMQIIYAYGYGEVKRDKAKRIDWLIRGIESNVSDCMCDMALLCIAEDSTYQDIHNPQRAIELLKRATRHGCGEAYYNLGNLYYNGEYLPKSDKKAFENWEKAVELECNKAASNLAYAYMSGVGCEMDKKKGVEIYKQSVEKKNGFSARQLYLCYYEGRWGMEKNIELAKKYLLKAAEYNDPVGCYYLGMHYYWADGLMDKNTDQAFVYIKKAADMGNVDACNKIAYFYENGIGCDKDPQKAKEYRDKTIAN